MTTQVNETIIHENKEIPIFGYPLEHLGHGWQGKIIEGEFVSRFSINDSSNWSGYRGTWTVDDGKLFLIKIDAFDTSDNPITLYDIFQTSKLFAYWFSGEISAPTGDYKIGEFKWECDHTLVWEFEHGFLKKQFVREYTEPLHIHSNSLGWREGYPVYPSLAVTTDNAHVMGDFDIMSHRDANTLADAYYALMDAQNTIMQQLIPDYDTDFNPEASAIHAAWSLLTEQHSYDDENDATARLELAKSRLNAFKQPDFITPLDQQNLSKYGGFSKPVRAPIKRKRSDFEFEFEDD